jgi:uncharacterized protein YdhG (YjbR/CyaY superfamily)
MMKTVQPIPQTIDEYIAGFPQDVQEILLKIRQIVRETAPGATETISYQMPTFRLESALVHFAAFKKHIGFYPVPSGIEAFKEELAEYITGKGTLQFPLDQPIPYDLIRRVVAYRVQENLAKAAAEEEKALIRNCHCERSEVVSRIVWEIASVAQDAPSQ